MAIQQHIKIKFCLIQHRLWALFLKVLTLCLHFEKEFDFDRVTTVFTVVEAKLDLHKSPK